MARQEQSQSGQDERWRADPIESKMAVEFSIPLSDPFSFAPPETPHRQIRLLQKLFKDAGLNLIPTQPAM